MGQWAIPKVKLPNHTPYVPQTASDLFKLQAMRVPKRYWYLFRSLSFSMCIYMYIEREREREIYIYNLSWPVLHGPCVANHSSVLQIQLYNLHCRSKGASSKTSDAPPSSRRASSHSRSSRPGQGLKLWQGFKLGQCPDLSLHQDMKYTYSSPVWLKGDSALRPSLRYVWNSRGESAFNGMGIPMREAFHECFAMHRKYRGGVKNMVLPIAVQALPH